MQIIARTLEFGPHRMTAMSLAAFAAPYMLAGRQMYALGHGSSELGPIGREHLVGDMGGIWVHPARIADGVDVALHDGRGQAVPPEGATLREQLAQVIWEWRAGDLLVERCDRVLPDVPIHVSRVSLHNPSLLPIEATLVFTAHLRFRGCWFGGITTGQGRYWVDQGLVHGEAGPGQPWGVAFGGDQVAKEHSVTANNGGALASLHYEVVLAPGATAHWHVLLAASLSGGSTGAARLLRERRADALLLPTASDDVPPVDTLTLECLHADLARDFALAKANLAMLEAEYPDTGAYFLAGLPEYPQLFGCDTAYSVPGAVAAGFAPTTASALRTLARYAERACGRIPHEITTNGRVFNPGNIQETPQFVIACWDYVRWTGDLDFARELFPLCREGMLELVPAHCGPQGRYPLGDGMVERTGMGSHKLDSACYSIAGLDALAHLAEALGDADAPRYAAWAAELRTNFEGDWWMEDEGLYADSMHSDGQLQLDGHWTGVLPVQLGIAAPERARRVLQRIEGEFVNRWGLVHTRTREELVWTLPTGLLALTYFANGRAVAGLQMAQHIARTTQYGTLGSFKELIPEGLCFVQLWSAALYIQAIVEGLLGIAPDGPRHALAIAPCMPADHPPVTLRALHVGAHKLDITVSPEAVSVFHHEGPQPLLLTYRDATISLAPGASQVWKGGDA